jgi:hypothetical protein
VKDPLQAEGPLHQQGRRRRMRQPFRLHALGLGTRRYRHDGQGTDSWRIHRAQAGEESRSGGRNKTKGVSPCTLNQGAGVAIL